MFYFLSIFLAVNCWAKANYSIKEKLNFTSDMESNVCEKVTAKDGKSDWYEIQNKNSKALYLMYKCTKYSQTEGFGFELKPGMVHGGVDFKKFYILNLTSGIVSELNTGEISFLANPSLCGTGLAFWQTENKTGQAPSVRAVVFDAKNNKLLESKILGSDSIETDNPVHFASPVWDKSCKTVSFPAGSRQNIKPWSYKLQ